MYVYNDFHAYGVMNLLENRVSLAHILAHV